MECGDTKSKYLFEKKENLSMEYNIVKAYQENMQLHFIFASNSTCVSSPVMYNDIGYSYFLAK